jgi:hypothetical protein
LEKGGLKGHPAKQVIDSSVLPPSLLASAKTAIFIREWGNVDEAQTVEGEHFYERLALLTAPAGFFYDQNAPVRILLQTS